MEMRNRLTAHRTAVRDDSITVTETEFCRQFPQDAVKMTEQGAIVFRQPIRGSDFPLRNHQNVNGGLWIDVPKRQTEIVFVDDVRRNFPINNTFENRFVGHERICGWRHRNGTRRRLFFLLPFKNIIVRRGSVLVNRHDFLTDDLLANSMTGWNLPVQSVFLFFSLNFTQVSHPD